MLKNRIRNPIIRGLIEWILAIGLALLLFLVLRMYVFRVATVSGSSMMPTLSDGDRLILNRAAVVFSELRVGDIVAYPYPGNPSEYHIKRVIGVYGDIVDFDPLNGRFIVNDMPLDDAFSYELILSGGNVGFPITVEEGRLFVLGDNRNGSKDSRYSTVGTIASEDIIGRVLLRIWPFDSFGQVN